jgi:cell division protein FtsQ
MDGGRRLLESMTGAIASMMPARLRPAAAAAGFPAASARKPAPRRRTPRRSMASHLADIVTRRGFGTVLAVCFIGSISAYGMVRGGQYEAFVAEVGRPSDALARAFGFGITAITLSGQKELLHSEIVQAAGITNRDSVLFLDAHAVRQRLIAMPLVREASVRKLYPDQVVISIEERTAHALWQIEGEVAVISADGKVIDQMRDQRFTRLPFVVGEGANTRVADYLKILDAAGDLKARVSAGVLIGQRRWNLKLNNGIDVRLPELNPEAAVTRLAKIVREHKLADKDIISIDMRAPDRVVVRLSEEAAAQRLEAKSKKARPKGGAA